MAKPECPACGELGTDSGVIPLPDGNWFCGDCNYSFDEED